MVAHRQRPDPAAASAPAGDLGAVRPADDDRDPAVEGIAFGDLVGRGGVACRDVGVELAGQRVLAGRWGSADGGGALNRAGAGVAVVGARQRFSDVISSTIKGGYDLRAVLITNHGPDGPSDAIAAAISAAMLSPLLVGRARERAGAR